MRVFFVKLFLMFFLMFFVSPVFAQGDKLTLTIAPPLIKNNMDPGETWVSYVKVVNNNSKKMTVFAHVFDFKSSPDGGVEFLQNNFREKNNDDETSDFLLSNWIDVTNEAIDLNPGESKEVPFVVKAPETAEPGGHYAAILIGTNPSNNLEGSGLNTSSFLSSLVMINVGGDTVEKADIREFSVEKSIYEEPKVDFTVRFENTGNVHVQPRGEIKIYDFWGNEKGSILINHNSDFGNVLPGSVRKWNFFWEGEKKISEMGRYKASLVLTYGEEAKETVFYNLYFWVVYWKILFSVIFGVVFVIFLIVLMIKRSVKNAVTSARLSAGLDLAPEDKDKYSSSEIKEFTKRKMKAKVVKKNDKVVDLRGKM